MTLRLAVACLVALTGCVNKYDVVTPELHASMISDLQAGRLTLDCGARCAITWITQSNSLHPLDMAEKWDDLAISVMKIGFGNDLAYYYLGQAAQGLNYQQAAIGYYGYSLGLATGQNALLKCEAGQSQSSDPCQGVDLVSSIPVLVQASRDAIAQQQLADEQAAKKTASAARRRHVSPVKTMSSSTGGSGWVAPPAAPASSDTGSSGWTAPPPGP